MTDDEKHVLDELAEEHDIPTRVPIVSIWRAADSLEEFIDLANEAKKLYDRVGVEVEVPEEAREIAEAQLSFEERLVEDLPEEQREKLEAAAVDRQELLHDRILETVELRFQF